MEVISFGIDQARRSGWGIARGRKMLAAGVALRPEDVEGAVTLARRFNGGTLHGVIVVMEDHTAMRADRLTGRDTRTVRGVGERWVQRSPTKLLIGLGDARGRWRHVLEREGHPVAQRQNVDPLVWRRAMGISGPGAKELACRVAEVALGRPLGSITDDDLAEGVCLTLYAAGEGRLRDELRRRGARAEAMGRKQAAGQLKLAEMNHGSDRSGGGRERKQRQSGGDGGGGGADESGS